MTVKTLKTPKRHYSIWDGKTLCGLSSLPDEDYLSEETNCKECLKEAIRQHYQLALLAKHLLTTKKV